MGKVPFAFSYVSNIRQDFGGVELKLTPQVLGRNISTDYGDKTCMVNFTAKEDGFYSFAQKAAIRFEVDEITYNGAKVEPFSAITYTLPYSVQTK